jgi:hypothetical protein
MKALFIVALGCAFIVGCGDSGSKPSGAAPATPAGSSDYLSTITKAEHSAVKSVDVSAVTKAIQMFQVEQGRLPKDLNELVSMKYMPKIPDAPAGQKIDYDPNTGAVKITAQ